VKNRVWTRKDKTTMTTLKSADKTLLEGIYKSRVSFDRRGD